VPKQASSGGPAQLVKRLTEAMHPFYGGWTYTAIAMYLLKAIFSRELALDQATNDIVVACPLGAMAALTRAQGPKVFVYKFDRTIPGKGESKLGAFHSLELPYIFNAFHDRTWQWLPFTEADEKLAETIETYWTNFAKTGDPNSPGVPVWPAWKNSSNDYLEVTPNGSPVSARDFAPPFCDLSPDWLRKNLLNSN
jgi:carboxylesterase type B